VLLFCHLFVGIMIGLLIYNRSGDKRLVFLTAIAAMLPDIIDKPMGHIIFKASIDYGRLYMHGLVVLSLFAAASLFLSKTRYYYPALALTAGVFSHQIIDCMWSYPVIWFYPLLGPFPHYHFPDYFMISFLREVTSPSEWIFAIISTGIIIKLYRGLCPERRHLRHVLDGLSSGVMRCAKWVLALEGVLILAFSLVFNSNDPLQLQNSMMLGTICLFGALFMNRWYEHRAVYPELKITQ